VRNRVAYVGPYSLLGQLIAARPRGETGADTASFSIDALQYSALWAERRWQAGRRLQLMTGIRAEIGSEVTNGGEVRFAPRLVGRWDLGSSTSASLGWARSYQYMQDVAPTAGPIGPQLHLSAAWVLASESPFRPAARADVWTLGAERWFGDAWLATATGYRRATSGLMIPNPAPGEVTLGRTPDAIASNAAHGVELSVQKLAGRWTGSLGYSFGQSRLTTTPGIDQPDGVPVTFPASADIRHAVDVTGMAQVGERMRVGGAFSYASGVPFTQLVLADSTRPGVRPRLREPNARRTPTYASLDLMLDYSRTFGSWQVSGYAQLRNALGRNNAVTYLGSVDCRPVGTFAAMSGPRLGCDGDTGVVDRFYPGLPRLPLVGVRVEF
jgi:hypothetical protein